MHQEVRDWFGELRRQYLEAFVCDSVLECGSYNVNGSVRGLFAARSTWGWTGGRGRAWTWSAWCMSTSLAGILTRSISTEMLEHDPHWRESVQRMIELVKPGGRLIITCAAPGRGEHELACSPEAEYYHEIGGAELANLTRSWFDRVRWWQMPPGNPGGCSVDTYLLGLGRW